MNVNINNLRKQALYTYSRLCDKLNRDTCNEILEIQVNEIQKEMDDLRMYLCSLACVFIEGNESFKDISEEINLDTISHFYTELDEE